MVIETKQDLIGVLIENGIVGSADEWNRLSFYRKGKKCEKLVKLPQFDLDFAGSVGYVLEEYDPSFKPFELKRSRL